MTSIPFLRNPGAQVLHAPGLYTPPAAHWAARGPVRGGVPVIFPQFNRFGAGARHGCARERNWAIASADNDTAEASLQLSPIDGIAARLQLHAQRRTADDARGVRVALEATSNSDTDQAFGAALHTYLDVGDVSACVVHGLQDCAWLDCAGGAMQWMPPTRAPLTPVDETDRIYLLPDACAVTVVQVQGPSGVITVRSQGFANVVVWNPGPQLGAALDGIPQGDWQRFLCIEAAHVFVDEQSTRPTLGAAAAWAGWQEVALSATA